MNLRVAHEKTRILITRRNGLCEKFQMRLYIVFHAARTTLRCVLYPSVDI